MSLRRVRVFCFWAVLVAQALHAEQLVVSSPEDGIPTPTGTLRDVINMINGNIGPSTTWEIRFAHPMTINLVAPLPPILDRNANVTIDGTPLNGSGSVVVDGQDKYAGFVTGYTFNGNPTTPTISLSNITMQNCASYGGAGGAPGGGGGAGAGGVAFVGGGVTFTVGSNVSLLNNKAVGGAGGAPKSGFNTGGGGGGGGIGGGGGGAAIFVNTFLNTLISGGGGGGGFAGNGGSSLVGSISTTTVYAPGGGGGAFFYDGGSASPDAVNGTSAGGQNAGGGGGGAGAPSTSATFSGDGGNIIGGNNGNGGAGGPSNSYAGGAGGDRSTPTVGADGTDMSGGGGGAGGLSSGAANATAGGSGGANGGGGGGGGSSYGGPGAAGGAGSMFSGGGGAGAGNTITSAGGGGIGGVFGGGGGGGNYGQGANGGFLGGAGASGSVSTLAGGVGGYGGGGGSGDSTGGGSTLLGGSGGDITTTAGGNGAALGGAFFVDQNGTLTFNGTGITVSGNQALAGTGAQQIGQDIFLRSGNSSNGAALVFTGTSDFSIASIQGDASFAGTGYTDGGVTLNGATVSFTATSPKPNTYNGGTTLNNNSQLNTTGAGISGTGTITLAGSTSSAAILNITNNESVTNAITLVSSSTTPTLNQLSANSLQTATFTGVITGPSSPNVTTLQIGGSGTVALENTSTTANSFAGSIDVLSGATLQSSDPTNNFSGNTITLDGGTLLSGGTITYPNDIKIGTSGGFLQGGVPTISGAISGSGTMTIGGQVTLAPSTTSTFSGPIVIDNGALLEIASSAALGDLTSPRQMTIHGGGFETGLIATGNVTLPSTLGIVIDSTANIDVNNGAFTLKINGEISGSGLLEALQTAASTDVLELAGANTYSGGTEVFNGTLALSGSGTVGTGTLTVDNSGTAAVFDISGFTSATTVTLGGLAGGGNVNLGTGTANTLQVNSDSGTTFSGILGESSSTGILEVTGSGTGVFTLSGANNYASTTISGGTLSFSADDNLGSTTTNGGITFSPSGSTPAILQDTGGITSSRVITFSSGSGTIKNTSGSTTTLGAITIDSGATATIQTTNSGTTTLGALSGAGDLTISEGIVVLGAAANSYSGLITVDSGATLKTSSDTNLGTPGVAIQGGVFEATGSFSTTKAITGTANSTIDVALNESVTLSSTVDGAGPIFTTPSGGTLTMTIGYFGGTEIQGGTLITSGDLSGHGTITVDSGATFSISGDTTVDAVDGSGTISLGGTLTLETSSPTTFSGVIEGTGGITLNATDTQTLSGSNTYTGTTTIEAGTLSVSGDANLGASTAPVDLAGGTLNISSGAVSTVFNAARNFSVTALSNITVAANAEIDGDIMGSHALTITGQTFSPFGPHAGPKPIGSLTLTAANALTGNMTISSVGTGLYFSSTGSLASSVLTLESGTFLDISGVTSPTSVRGLSGDGEVHFGTGTQTNLQIDSTTNTSFAGILGETKTMGEITITGTGTFGLTGILNQQTTTNIQSGVLSIFSDASLGVSGASITFTGNGTLETIAGLTTGRPIALSTFTGSIKNSSDSTTTLNGTITGGSGSNLSIAEGTVEVSPSDVSGFSGDVTVQSGATLVTNVTSLTTGGKIVLEENGTFLLGAQSLTVTDPIHISPNCTIAPSDGYTVGIQAISGIGPLLTSSTGTLVLNNDTLTYVGGTQIQSGGLSINNNASLSGTGVVTIDTQGTLGFGSTLTAPISVDGLTGAGTVNLQNTGSAAINLLIDSTTNTSFAGAITDGGFGGGITIIGSGTFTLTGTSSSYFLTTIDTGTLSIASDGNLGTYNGGITFSNYGTLQITGTSFSSPRPIDLIGTGIIQNTSQATAFFTGPISGTGNLLISQGTVELNNPSPPNTYSGTTTIAAGTMLTITNAGQLGSTSLLLIDGGTLNVTGGTTALTAPVSVAPNSTIDVASTVTFELSGGVSGAGQLIAVPSGGTLELSGVNTYAGGTLIKGTGTSGTLSLLNTSALAGTGVVTIESGATLDIHGAAGPDGNAVTVAVDGLAGSGAVTFGGNSLAIDSSSNTSFPGTLGSGGAGGLVIVGTGLVDLTGSSGYLGETTVSSGATLRVGATSNISSAALVLGGGTFEVSTSGLSFPNDVILNADSTIDVPSADTLTLSGVISGSGGLLATPSGGTLTLSGTNNTYTGGTEIQAGTLISSGGLPSTGTVTVDDSALLQLGADTSIGALAGSSASATVDLGTYTLTIGNNTTDSTTYAGLIEGSGSIDKARTSTLVLSNTGNSGYTWATKIEEGVLSFSSDANLGTGTVTLAGGTLLANFDAAPTLTSSLTYVLTAQSTLDADAGVTFQVTTAITGSGGLYTTGSTGTLELQGANGYSGGTHILNGTLALTGLGNLLSTGTVTVDSPGKFDVSSLTSSSIDGLAGTGFVELGAADLTIDSTSNTTFDGKFETSTTGTITIKGTGTFTLTGILNEQTGTTLNSGTLSVSNTHNLGTTSAEVTFSGDSTLQDTFGISSPPTRPFVIETGVTATFSTTKGKTTTIDGAVSGSGDIDIVSGTVVFGNANTSYSGNVTVSSGATLGFTGTGSLGSNAISVIENSTLSLNTGSTPITVTPDVTLDVPNGNTATRTGVISGVGPVLTTPSGGTLILEAVNTYVGGTEIEAGTLEIGSGGSIAGTGVVTIDSGATFALGTSASIDGLSGSGSVTLGANNLTISSTSNTTYAGVLGEVSTTGTITVAGSGVFTLEGSNNFANAIIQTGTLSVSSVGNLGTGGVEFSRYGTLQDTAGLTIPNTITLDFGATGIIQNISGASTVLEGQITGSGNFAISQGTVELNNTGSSPNDYGGTTRIASSAILSFSDTAQLGNTSSVLLDGGTLLMTGTGTLSTPVVLSPNSTIDVDSGSTLTVNGNISGAGKLIVAPSGGTLELKGGTNSYAGGTEVQGTLSLVGAGTYAITTSLSGTGTLDVKSGGTFDIHAIKGTDGTPVTAIDGLIGAGTVQLGGNILAIDSTSNTTFGGVIEGSGGIDITGSGTFTFGSTAANTYTGQTTIASDASLEISAADNINTSSQINIDGGTLIFKNAMTISPAKIVISPNSTLRALSVADVTISSFISGTGPLRTAYSYGYLRLNYSGQLKYTGGTYVQASKVFLEGGVSLQGTGTVTVDAGPFDVSGVTSLATQIDGLEGPAAGAVRLGGTTLTIDSSSNTQFDGQLGTSTSDTGGITIVGTGTFTLGGTSNLYQGTTTIESGTLSIASQSNLGATSGISFTGDGTLQDTGLTDNAISLGITINDGVTASIASTTAVTTISGVIQDATSGGNLKIASGSVTIPAATTNTYTGTTTIANGATLTIGAAANISTAPLTIEGGTLAVSATGLSLSNAISLTATSTIAVPGSDTLTLSGDISGAGALILPATTGTLTLHGTNSYTGGTEIQGGILSLTGSLYSQGTVTIDGSGEFDIGLSTSIGALSSASTSSSVHLGGHTLTIGNDTTTSTTFAGSIAVSAGALTKTRTSTQILTGSNGYTGETTIEGGVLGFSADGNLGTATNVALAGGTLRGIGTVTSSFHYVLSAPSTLDATGTFTIANAITGTGGLTTTPSGGTLVLKASNGYTGGTTISAGTLELNGGSLSTTGIVTIDSGGTLTTTGDTLIDALSGSGTCDIATHILTLGSTFSGTFTGDITGTTGSALVKQGFGKQVLGGANTYTNGTTLNAGALSVSADENLGALSSNITLNGGILEFTGVFSTLRTIALDGFASLSVADGAELTAGGAISGTYPLRKTGLGILKLSSGMNNYSGGTEVLEGRLTLGSSGSLGSGPVTVAGAAILDLSAVTSSTFDTLSGSGTVLLGSNSLTLGGSSTTGIFAGVISGTGGSLTKSGTGTLTLTGTNLYTGGTVVEGGVLNISDDVNLGASSGSVTLSGGTLQAQASLSTARAITLTTESTLSATSDVTFTVAGNFTTSSSTLHTSGLGTVVLGGINTSFSGTLAIDQGTLQFSTAGNLGSGGIGIADGATLQAVLSGDVTVPNAITLTGTGIFDVSDTHTLTLSTALAAGTIGGGLEKTNTGTLTLSAAAGYTTGTTITQGKLSLSGAGNLSGTGPVSIGAAGTLDVTGLSGTSATIDALSGSGSVNLGAKTLAVGADNSSTTYSGTISGSATGVNVNLSKVGTGTLTLAGTNSYTGTTQIAVGTLSVSANSNLGAANAGISFTGSSVLQATGTFSATRAIALTSGVIGTIDVTLNQTLTLTLNGATSGGGTWQKTGPGTLVTQAANAHTGGTHVVSGTLQLTGSSASLSGTGLLTVDVGATCDVSGAGAQSIDSLAGGGTVLFGSNTFSVGDSTSTTFAGNLQGTGTLVKLGMGTLSLTGLNSHTGGTTVSAGTLSLANAGILDELGEVTVYPSAHLYVADSTVDQVIGSLTTGSGGVLTLGAARITTGGNNASTTHEASTTGTGEIIKAGIGTFTLAGNSPSYTGTLRAHEGNLKVNANWSAATTIVELGATLSGTGTLGTTIVGGTLSPGNSIGTMSFGDTTLAGTSVTVIEANAAGQSSSNNINGDLTIDGGATLDVTFDSGTYIGAYKYTIFTISNTRTGTFTATNFSGIPSGYTAEVEYSPDPHIYVLLSTSGPTPPTPTPSGPSALSGNCAAVGNVILNATPASGSDLANIIKVLRALPADQLCPALDQLQSSYFGDLAQTQALDAVRVRETVTHRLRELYTASCAQTWVREHPVTIWAAPFADFSHQDHSGQFYSYHTGTEGAVLGSDARFTDKVYAGAAAAYTHTEISWRPKHGHGHADSAWGGLYLAYFARYIIPDISIFGSYNHYDETREIHFSTIERQAKNAHSGFEIAGHLSITGKPPTFYDQLLQPFVYADYIYVHEKPFREHGAGVLNLKVHHRNTQYVRTEMGALWSTCLTMHKVPRSALAYAPNVLTPELKLSWVWERAIDTQRFVTNFTTFGNAFVVKDRRPIRSLFSAEAGVTAYIFKNASLGFRYAGEIGSHYWDNRVYLRVDIWL